MKIFISEHHRQTAQRVALLNIARLYRIPYCEYLSNHELYEQLVPINSPLRDALNDYIDAYDAWFDFYTTRKLVEQRLDIDYNFNSREKLELGELIITRQNALEELERQYQALRMVLQ
jgi:hypothetical protein